MDRSADTSENAFQHQAIAASTTMEMFPN